MNNSNVIKEWTEVGGVLGYDPRRRGDDYMLNLYLVTFEGDNTQFLVNAENPEQAIAYANEANIHCGGIDDEDGCPYDLNNPKEEWYSLDIVDWDMLQEICARDDYMFTTGRAVVFND